MRFFFQKLPEAGIDINQIDVDRKKLLKQLQSVSIKLTKVITFSDIIWMN